MRLAIFTHVIHQKQKGRYFAYNPYVREMNLWLKHVGEVEVVAPLSQLGEIKKNGLSYQHSNLSFTRIPSIDLLKIVSTIKAVVNIPTIIFRIMKAMRRADHIHLRCPGNIGLLASMCQIFFPGKPKTAKYAGNWDPQAKQPWTYKLQKNILSSPFLTKNMKVLVYGSWQDQSKNVLPFFTASFSESQKEKIEKNFNPPLMFLFVGNLVPGKQPLFAIRLLEAIKERNINAELHIYGNGEIMDELYAQAENKVYIKFHGNQSLNILKQAYEESHFLILASKSEGWPKAVAEAMFFGCIPISTGVSCVPWMLNWGSRGILIPEIRVERGKWKEDSQYVLERENLAANAEQEDNNLFEETVVKITKLLKNPEEMKRMSIEAQEWSQQYTLERFEEAIKKVLFPKGIRP